MSNTPDSQSLRGAVQDAKQGARTVANHPWFEKMARAGYVMSGLVHAMIGWICIRLGMGSGSEESADQTGALATFADNSAGALLLIVGGIAMVALAVYHLLDIFFGSVAREDGKERIFAIGKAIGKAVTYAVLAFTALRFGFGSSADEGGGTESLTEPFFSSTWGKWLIAGVGLAAVIVGGYHVYKGATKKFLEDLKGSSDANIGRGIEVTGMIGYIAKGISLVGGGIMFVWAAASADPEKTSGMDAAFSQILTLPAGGMTLIAIGVGFILFGIYSVLRAKYQQMD